MSKKSDAVISDINAYIDSLRDAGRMPTVVHITPQQMKDLQAGMGKSDVENWKPRIRTIPIEVRE